MTSESADIKPGRVHIPAHVTGCFASAAVIARLDRATQ